MKNQFCSRMQNLKPINIISFSHINVNRKIKNAAACGQKNAAVTESETASAAALKKRL